MKDSIIINSTKEKVFNCLKKSIVEDIRKTGRDIDGSELKAGYQYSKKSVSNDNKTYTFHVTISEYNEPNSYESTLLQGSLKYVTRYDFVNKNGGVEVTYTERIFNEKGKEAKTLFNWILFAFKKKSLRGILEQFKEVVERGE